MNIQIFGTKKCNDTKKAERFFKERGIKYQFINKKARRGSSKNHIKGPKKRTSEDDERFAQSFEKLVLLAQAKEGEQNGAV